MDLFQYVPSRLDSTSPISLVTYLFMRELAFRYRDGFSSVFHHFLHVDVGVITRNYVCRLGPL